MNPNFVSRFAPELSLEGAAPQAGLVSEKYDAQGTPLPFLRSGGQRQYFGVEGPDGLRGRQPDEPIAPAPVQQSPFGTRLQDEPVAGLRGLTQEAPQNMLVTGRPGNTVRIPPMQSPQEIEAQIRNGAGLRPVGPTRESIENRVGGAAIAERTIQELLGADNLTLGELLQQSGFQIPQIPSFLRNATDGLRGRYDSIDDMPQVDTTVDVNSGLHRGPPTFNLSTPQGLTEFNARMGLNLGNQVRTEAEQRSLFNRGLTTTMNSYHRTGEAFDMPASQLDGKTRGAAVEEVTRRLREAGYDVSRYEVQWERGGRHQGTGPHVHVEPRR